MPRLGSDSFVIQRAPLLIDPRDGSSYRDWNNPVQTTVRDANVQPFMMAEKLNFEENRDREFSRTAIRVYAPPGTDVESTDRIVYNSRTYDVFGTPGDWHRFSGLKNHVAFIARIREG